METNSNALSFDDLSDDTKNTVLIEGNEWRKERWPSDIFRRLVRQVQSGFAKIEKLSNNNYRFSIEAPESHIHCEIVYEHTYPDLRSAVKAAETFEWLVTECGDFKWYQTRNNTDKQFKEFRACMSETDVAVINFHDGKYSMNRHISPRYGELYEIKAIRYDSCDEKNAVTNFNEAVAIVTTLPRYLSALASTNNNQQDDGDVDSAAGTSPARPRF